MEPHVEVDADRLPKLEKHGFVDWSRDTDEVTRGANFDDIRPLLDVMAEHEDGLPLAGFN